MADQGPEDIVWRRDEIESPCIQVCVIHPDTKLCIGCARSLQEIGGWSQMSVEARRSVMEDLPNRTPAPTARRGGRTARRR